MKTIKLVLGFALIVGAFFACWRIVPPYFYHYQFSDALENVTMSQIYRDTGEEDMRTLVIRTARENGVDLKPEDVTVNRTGLGLTVNVAYTVPVDLVVTQLQLNFTSSSSGKRY